MIPDKVKNILDRHGLSALEFEEGSTPTAETAAAKIGVQVGQIAKSLLFKGASGKIVMVVCAGDRKISSGKLKRHCGEKMSMTSGEETYALTGFRPGGVCPFGVEGFPVYIDDSLKVWDRVYPAAGNDATGVPMTYVQLLEISGGLSCDVSAD
ncbi:MAG: YbaK/prolyl-tRNA synthetase associated protein [Spirochaetes bacterium]|nr:MAG: YbaK/prolyl-tRNA synthetase associated protein [Spirochaetota bacterium]